MALLDDALRYASLGWHVFPVAAKSKHPVTAAGFRDATDDPRQISAWWARRNHNVGVSCGASKIVVVDVDLPYGPDSIRALDVHLPATLTQKTGSGGRQFVYRAPSWPLHNTAGRLPGVGKLLGVDLRATGGYVVVPPSIHPNGKPYEWVHRVWPASCPDWLRETEKPKPEPEPYPRRVGDAYAQAAIDGECLRVVYSLKGSRNNTLVSAAFSLGGLVQNGGLTEPVITERLRAAALQAGLDAKEADATIASGLRSGMEHPRRLDGAAD